MKTLPLFLITVFCTQIYAQNITNASFPEVGDIVKYKTDIEFDVPFDLGSIGANMVWDLSTFDGTKGKFENYIAPTPEVLEDYPDCNLVEHTGSNPIYYQATDNDLRVIGFSGESPFSDSSSINLFKPDPYILIRPANMELGDRVEHNYAINFSFGSDQLPGEFLDSLGGIVDSIRLSINSHQEFFVDATGTMKLKEHGDIEVVKIRTEVNADVKIEALISGLVWTDVTQFVPQEYFPEYDENYYAFYNDEFKGAVAMVYLDSLEMGVSMDIQTFGDIDTKVNNLDLLDANVYPNPTNQFINIELENTKNGSFQFELYDLNGKQVFVSKHKKHENRIQVDISALKSGIYFGFVKFENGAEFRIPNCVIK